MLAGKAGGRDKNEFLYIFFVRVFVCLYVYVFELWKGKSMGVETGLKSMNPLKSKEESIL